MFVWFNFDDEFVVFFRVSVFKFPINNLKNDYVIDDDLTTMYDVRYILKCGELRSLRSKVAILKGIMMKLLFVGGN